VNRETRILPNSEYDAKAIEQQRLLDSVLHSHQIGELGTVSETAALLLALAACA